NVVTVVPLVVILGYHAIQLTEYWQLPSDAAHVELGRPSGLSISGFEQTARWLTLHSTADDIIAARHDVYYFLNTGRRGVRPWIPKPEAYSFLYGRQWSSVLKADVVQKELDRLHVTVLIADKGL